MPNQKLYSKHFEIPPKISNLV